MDAPEIRFGTDGWRAVIADDFTFENVRRIASAAGRVFAEDHAGCPVLVGYDTRFEAAAFARVAAEEIAAAGLPVLLSDRMLPTPALSWATQRSDACAGIMLTASHNPARWLGFKIKMADGGSAPVSLTARVEAEIDGTGARAGGGSVEETDLVGPYLQALQALVDVETIRKADLRVLVDPLYGAGQGYLAGVLSSMGVEVGEIHGDPNPGFGGLHPEPIPPHVDEARATVTGGGYAAGFFTDGDADRIGACDGRGAFVNPHRIFALVVRNLVEERGMRGKVVKTLSTSGLIDRISAHLGLECETTPVGFKWIYEKMVEGGVLIGGEESGGIGFPAHVPERDALLMALFLTEMMAKTGKGLDRLIDDLFAITGPLEYGRVDLKIDPSVKERFLAELPSLAPAEVAGRSVRSIDRRDGVKFLLPDAAWLLLRVSGTEPLVRVYAEGGSMSEVEEVLEAGKALVAG